MRKVYIFVLTMLVICAALFGTLTRYGGSITFGSNGLSIFAGPKVTKTYNLKEEFSSIVIESDALDINIRKSNKAKLTYSGPKNQSPKVDTKNDVLTIKDIKKLTKNARRNMVLYLTDKEYKSLKITCDAGDVDVRDTQFASTTMDVDAGDIDVEDATLGNHKLTCDAGDIDFSNCQFKDVDVKVDAGDFDLEDSSFNNISVEVDAGSASIKSNKSLKDYSLDLSTDVGRVEVNDENHGTKYQSVGHKYTAKVKVDMGSIDIEY